MNKKKLTYVTKISTVISLCVIMILGVSFVLYGEDASVRENAENKPCKKKYKQDLEIVFDFLKGTLTPKKGDKAHRFVVAKGRNITFRVININRFNYNVEINGEVLDHNSVAPDVYSKPGVKKADEEKKKAADEQKDKEEIARQAKAGEIDIKKEMENLENAINRLSKIKNLQVQLEKILLGSESYMHLEFQKKKLFENFPGLKGDDSPEAVEKKFKQIVKDANLTIKRIKAFIGKDNIDKMKIRKADIEAFVKDKKNRKFLADYYEKLSIYFQNLATYFQMIFENFSKIFQLEKLLDEFETKGYISRIKQLLDNFKPENFSVSLTVPTVDTDEVQFKVKIKPAEGKKVKVHHQLNGPVVVKVRGGWKIDFSTGIMFVIDAHDRSYRFDDSPDDPEEVILREDTLKHSISPVVGPMMHIHLRQIGKLKWTLTFGMGTGKADSLSYYLGLGLMLGSKKRFVISFGAAAAKYDRLLPEYRDFVGKVMPKNDDLTPADLVRDAYKLRAFVSLTYNITN